MVLSILSFQRLAFEYHTENITFIVYVNIASISTQNITLQLSILISIYMQGHADNPKVNAIVVVRGSLEEAGVCVCIVVVWFPVSSS